MDWIKIYVVGFQTIPTFHLGDFSGKYEDVSYTFVQHIFYLYCLATDSPQQAASIVQLVYFGVVTFNVVNYLLSMCVQ